MRSSLSRLLASLEKTGPRTCGDLARWLAAGDSVLPSSTGVAGAAAAVGRRLQVAAALLPSLPVAGAAQQLVSLRGFGSSASRHAALGVVDKLHEEVAMVIPADGRSRHFWEVSGQRAGGRAGSAAALLVLVHPACQCPSAARSCCSLLFGDVRGSSRGY